MQKYQNCVILLTNVIEITINLPQNIHNRNIKTFCLDEFSVIKEGTIKANSLRLDINVPLLELYSPTFTVRAEFLLR